MDQGPWTRGASTCKRRIVLSGRRVQPCLLQVLQNRPRLLASGLCGTNIMTRMAVSSGLKILWMVGNKSPIRGLNRV